MTYMPSYSLSEVVLIQYPFTNLTSSKVRPAVVVNAPHSSRDLIIVPLTSQLVNLLSGEFQLLEWQQAGLNVPTAVKRGLFTLQENLVIRKVGRLSVTDETSLEQSLRHWLDLR